MLFLQCYHNAAVPQTLFEEKNMPIFSYIAIPHAGAKEDLCAELSGIQHCQVVPAENKDIVVLVTDTPDDQVEKELQTTLKELTHLQSLSLAFGYDEQK